MLACDDWRKLRHELVAIKSLYTCQICKKKNDYWDLQIHHRVYIRGRKPWEYEREDLLVVCFDCHCELHKEPIPIYDSNENWIESRHYKIIDCEKCEGKGEIEALKGSREHNDGICYDCQGTGKVIDAVRLAKVLGQSEDL